MKYSTASIFVALVAACFILPPIFVNPSILGRVIEMDTTAVIINVTSAQCNTTFEQGWNLISIPCVPKPAPMSEVFYSVNSDYISLHTYSGTGQDPWKAYNPSLPSWVIQDLSNIDRKAGYWINMNQSAHFVLFNDTATPNIMNLNPGWNLVGYPTLTARNISEALTDLYPNYHIVYIYNATDTDWKEYAWNSSISNNPDLNASHPYYGYWIYMDTEDIWIIDW